MFFELWKQCNAYITNKIRALKILKRGNIYIVFQKTDIDGLCIKVCAGVLVKVRFLNALLLIYLIYFYIMISLFIYLLVGIVFIITSLGYLFETIRDKNLTLDTLLMCVIGFTLGMAFTGHSITLIY